MNTETAQKRDYESPLRANQAEETRSRILEALAEQVVEAGFEELSIDKVARRAGVSTRTVYHHFPNRDLLLGALGTWLNSRFELVSVRDARTLDEFLQRFELLFEAFDGQENLIRAQLVTSLGRKIREHDRSSRRTVLERLMKQAAPAASAAEIRRGVSVVHYLASSEAWRSLKDESGLSSREAAKSVIWAIRTLVAELNKSADS